MKLRFAMPSKLVDIGRLRDLSYVREDGDAVAIGALTRHHDVANERALQRALPHRGASVAGQVGDPQVRHMGTIGGSVAHADPASATCPRCCSRSARRSWPPGPAAPAQIAAADLFPGLFQSALANDEVLTEIRVPKTTGGWSYHEVHTGGRRTGRSSASPPFG